MPSVSRVWLGVTLLVGVALPASSQIRPRRIDTAVTLSAADELRSLETRWNLAHLRSDTTSLKQFLSDDALVLLPGLPVMRKQDFLASWRNQRGRLLRHQSSDVTIRTWNDAAVVEGVLAWQRGANNRAPIETWRFTKVLVKQAGRWRVVSYHASPLQTSRAAP